MGVSKMEKEVEIKKDKIDNVGKWHIRHHYNLNIRHKCIYGSYSNFLDEYDNEFDNVSVKYNDKNKKGGGL